ncbi:DUF1302 domain-containing protein [Solimonas terrae]|uniref:DUF1302 domain-containing protein n=1 Tax=Solimonas terrae TaxID=1396819 RepID=A0A6M2BWB1_9GAMM|nr:DUF1302 family protein [Solimonas terrae]NGY06932.1 DUF1302 domain-containing protein [Solimonas terrae]
MQQRYAFAFAWGAALLGLHSITAQALSFDVPLGDDLQIDGTLNTTVTAGIAVRMQSRSRSLVGKSNNDPGVCGRVDSGGTERIHYQSCQGLFREQTFPATELARAPGQFSINSDDGDLNYDRYDIVQAPFKITQDLNLTVGDWGLFVKGLYFYDAVNANFREYHPNRITSDNYLDVGYASTPGSELLPVNLPLPVSTLIVRNDSRPCPAYRNPTGGPCGIVYGPGGVVRNKRSDGETLKQIGTDLQLLDAYVYGHLPLPFDKELTVKIGRQTLNWGESTLLVFDSINSINPVNTNNFFRVGYQVEEVFTPVGMAFASFEPFDDATIETFYQYEWEPLEAPAPGSYFSFLDVGTRNAVNQASVSFGGAAEDPQSLGLLLDNPLSGITNTSTTIQRLRDRDPRNGGQYGAAFKYYAEGLGSGTELAFYFENYHARAPYVSFYATEESCAKHTTSTVEFLAACGDVPLLHALLNPNDPEGASSDAVGFDSAKLQVEYPENIKLFGLSFNTTVGAWSLQGEVAYRPNEPMQVDLEDLAFAAFGPTLTNCHLPDAGCAGTGNGLGIPAGALPAQLQQAFGALASSLGLNNINALGGIGIYEDPSVCSAILTPDACIYRGSDFVTANGSGGYNDTYDLLVGHMPGSGRAFPSFVIPYRGGVVGTNPGSDPSKPYNRRNPGYIRGWENFDSYEFNLGSTYVMGATDTFNFIKADQIITLFEFGATWVPGLPALDRLQLEAPGTYTHASAGADGSGADGSRQACSTNQACSYGPDGLRFNPHQQNRKYFPDKFSWGYVIISQIKYESVLPGISLQPQIVWKHDVQGTAPGLAANFIQGRKQADVGVEVRYRSSLSLNLGYTWFFGGGDGNLLRDRDVARTYLKYQF